MERMLWLIRTGRTAVCLERSGAVANRLCDGELTNFNALAVIHRLVIRENHRARGLWVWEGTITEDKEDGTPEFTGDWRRPDPMESMGFVQDGSAWPELELGPPMRVKYRAMVAYARAFLGGAKILNLLYYEPEYLFDEEKSPRGIGIEGFRSLVGPYCLGAGVLVIEGEMDVRMTDGRLDVVHATVAPRPPNAEEIMAMSRNENPWKVSEECTGNKIEMEGEEPYSEELAKEVDDIMKSEEARGYGLPQKLQVWTDEVSVPQGAGHGEVEVTQVNATTVFFTHPVNGDTIPMKKADFMRYFAFKRTLY